MSPPTLTVVCPAHNEAEVIEDFYTELAGVLAGLTDRYQSTILFVLDGCTDCTEEIVTRLAASDPCVQAIVLTSNFGHQPALLAGLDHCQSDWVVTMDSDLQHPPSVIPCLLSEAEKGVDIVSTLRRETNEAGILKNVTSALFYRLINRLSHVQIQSGSSDFRLLSRRVVNVFQQQIREQNLFFRGLVNWTGFKSSRVTFDAPARGAGQSKYTLPRMIRFAVSGVTAFTRRPLEAAIAVGGFFALIGLGLALHSVVVFFVYDAVPPGWATLATLVSFYSGIQLIFLGVLGEYLGAVFDEVKRRPHYLVDKLVNFEDKE